MELREILLSFHTDFNLVNAAVFCAERERERQRETETERTKKEMKFKKKKSN